MSDLFTIATKRPLYATDGVEIIRTRPLPDRKEPFVGYIKTTIGEALVPYSNKDLYEVLINGSEISKEEYENLEVTVRNYISLN